MENQNSVCYVATINEIKPIEGADNIELAVVGGWNCITKKGEHAVGDLIVVATTDAIIPVEMSDGMGVTNYLRKGQRVRTVKLRGVYSECLIIPLKYIPFMENYYEGKDMMYAMNIYKYEPPVKQVQLDSGKKIRYSENPNFHVYYKFPNLKNVAGMFTEEDVVEITRKLHGTNARYGIVRKNKLSVWDKVRKYSVSKFGVGRESWNWLDFEFIVGSHNVEKGSDSQGFYDTNVWYEIADKYELKDRLWDVFKVAKDLYNLQNGLVLYGEIYGAGIQKNYDYGLKEIEFRVFDITMDNEYLEPPRASMLTNLVFRLPYVEVLHFGNWSQEVQDKFVFNNFIEGSKVPHEGIVIKHETGSRQKVAKVINPDYLIYGEKHNVGDSH